MRKTKPPVGWEHVKNCFPVPNELLDFDLPGGSIAVYIFLLRHADRRTGQCHPSTATMAKNLHYCRNTVASYVRLLEERGLIITEHTKIITKNGIKKNGNLLYTIIPLQKVMEQHYEQQFNALERTTERRKVVFSLTALIGFTVLVDRDYRVRKKAHFVFMHRAALPALPAPSAALLYALMH